MASLYLFILFIIYRTLVMLLRWNLSVLSWIQISKLRMTDFQENNLCNLNMQNKIVAIFGFFFWSVFSTFSGRYQNQSTVSCQKRSFRQQTAPLTNFTILYHCDAIVFDCFLDQNNTTPSGCSLKVTPGFFSRQNKSSKSIYLNITPQGELQH